VAKCEIAARPDGAPAEARSDAQKRRKAERMGRSNEQSSTKHRRSASKQQETEQRTNRRNVESSNEPENSSRANAVRVRHPGCDHRQSPTSTWRPVAGQFGALPFIWGTLYSSLLALLLSTPVALGIAVFLAELSPRLIRQPLIFLTELLAAIPSIVYGLWGMFVLVPVVRSLEVAIPEWLRRVPLFSGPPLGVGMLAAALILYCRDRRIPLPANAKKSLRRVGEQVGLVVTSGLTGNGWRG